MQDVNGSGSSFITFCLFLTVLQHTKFSTLKSVLFVANVALVLHEVKIH